ncbi:hypothetical protein CTAYLR_003920 [Chrysophaeum taylorii]|uniref:Uncharacterized protein n=1 Tax=Chrysophaeum taylorii TaxID=2483200 RepID=A0AAD7U9J4_9STRA|nr:hypothetical protein CTAYLR_003920 [Chrysophaeum taylorii]
MPLQRVASSKEDVVLASLREEVSLEFSDENEEHVGLLKRLWDLAHGDAAPAFQRVGGPWTAFGFQRDDPVSDFRGGGVLALRNLVNFLERQPCYARPIMLSRQPSSSGFDPEAAGFFPFAAAGINVTRLLAEFAGVAGRPKEKLKHSCWSLLAGHEACFDECYALGFRLVDRCFDERGASYMDFNAVLKDAGTQMRAALEAASSARADYLPQRVDPRRPCAHDAVARVLRLAPPGWGTAPAAMRGVLEKLPVGGMLSSRKIARWRRRFFVLRGDLVAWFKPGGSGEADAASPAWLKAEVHGELTNYVRLTSQSAIRANLSDALSFKVERCLSPDSVRSKLRLRAASPADAQQWMRAIEAAIEAARDGIASPAYRNTTEINIDDLDADDNLTSVDGRDSPTALSESDTRDSSETRCFHPRDSSESTIHQKRSTMRRSRRLSFEAVRNVVRVGRADRAAAAASSKTKAPPLNRSTSWISCSDEKNQRVYYVHRPTGKTQWELPPGWTSSTSGWSARVDRATGHTYYFNPPTGETTWTLPER